MERKMGEVTAKLEHEREKFKRFDQELKEHDSKVQVRVAWWWWLGPGPANWSTARCSCA